LNKLPPNPTLARTHKLSSEIWIRQASIADIPLLAQLAQDVPLAAQWSLQQYRDIFEVSSPPRCSFVIEDRHTLLGFIVGRCLSEAWEIENIVIAPSDRRRGLGTELLREFIQWAQVEKAHSIWLEVRESNQSAQALYRKLGFYEIGCRKMYYAAPDEDGLTFQRKLPG
jgi:ribosomal-protein-alanine acetyltransferase